MHVVAQVRRYEDVVRRSAVRGQIAGELRVRHIVRLAAARAALDVGVVDERVVFWRVLSRVAEITRRRHRFLICLPGTPRRLHTGGDVRCLGGSYLPRAVMRYAEGSY